MKKNHVVFGAMALAGWGYGLEALAHLEYYDLNKGYQVEDRKDKVPGDDRSALPILDTSQDEVVENGGTWSITEATDTAPRTVSVTVNKGVKRFSWIAGTNASLGDSHAMQYFNFHLDGNAYVNIAWTQADSGLDPAFTLYKGLLPYQGHDDTSRDPLNPQQDFVPVQNASDTGQVFDVQGILSPFRDTVTPENAGNNFNFYVGQFNALDGWSMGRQGGDWWSAVQYLAHKNDNNGPSETLANFCLPAGDYTIAAGGAACNDPTIPACGYPYLSATLTYSATPAPPCNYAPVFTGNNDTLMIAKDSGPLDLGAHLHISDIDAGQTETWTQAVAPQHGSLSFTTASAASGTADIAPGGAVTYTPAAGYIGTDSFAIQVSDGTATAVREFSATIGRSAELGTCDTASGKLELGVFTGPWDASAQRELAIPLAVLDCGGAAIDLQHSTLPEGAALSDGALDTATHRWTQTLRWTPTPDQAGKAYTINFKAAQSSGPPSQPKKVKIRVWPTSRPADSIQSLTVKSAHWQDVGKLHAQGKLSFSRLLSQKERRDFVRQHRLSLRTVSGAALGEATFAVKPSGLWQATVPLPEGQAPCAVIAEVKGTQSAALDVSHLPGQCQE